MPCAWHYFHPHGGGIHHVLRDYFHSCWTLSIQKSCDITNPVANALFFFIKDSQEKEKETVCEANRSHISKQCREVSVKAVEHPRFNVYL